jgi:hypothetical protein
MVNGVGVMSGEWAVCRAADSHDRLWGGERGLMSGVFAFCTFLRELRGKNIAWIQI